MTSIYEGIAFVSNVGDTSCQTTRTSEKLDSKRELSVDRR